MSSAAPIATSLPPSAANTGTPAFTPEQIKELKNARANASKLRRTVKYARFDAWCVAVFAGLTFVFGAIQFDPTGLILGLGMAAVATVEFRAAAAVLRIEPRAARVLGFNQLAFAALLIAYACYQLHATATGPNMFAAEIERQGKEVADLLRPFGDLARVLGYAVYGTLIFIACTVQGGTALYFFTRKKHIERYAKETPAWITQLQREGLGF